MITEKKMYTVICDNCNADIFKGTEYSCVCIEMIPDEIDGSEWRTVGDKHYCTNCWFIDDDDELLINESRHKP